MRPILATTVADRKGRLIAKAGALAPVVSELFSGVSAFATTETHPELVRVLDSIGASIERADSDSDLIGRHRRRALGGALSLGVESHILYMDLDHLLRWIENDHQELLSTLQLIPKWGCLVIGRSPASLRALPRRLAETESIVNRIYYLNTGRSWDLMMSREGSLLPLHEMLSSTVPSTILATMSHGPCCVIRCNTPWATPRPMA